MPQINDAFNAAIADVANKNSLQEKLLRYYQANGATSNDVQDAEVEFLNARLIAAGDLQDRWLTYLRGKGFTGSLNEMKYAWAIGGMIV